MSRQAWRRVPTLMVLALAAVLSLTSAAEADNPPPFRLLSNYENVTGEKLRRDGGYSAPIPGSPGQSLWLFGDTSRADSQGNPLPGFWIGTFAARGPYTAGQVPSTLSHLPSPPTVPSLPNNNIMAPLVPLPPDFVNSDGEACTYEATWPNGLNAGPSSLMYIFMVDACVTVDPDAEPFGLDLEAKTFKVATYTPATNAVSVATVFSAGSPTSELPWQQRLFHPIFSGGYMYGYAFNCDSWIPAFGACGSGRAIVARVPQGSISNPNAYEYRRAASLTGWDANYLLADDVLDTPNALGPFMVHVGDFSSLGKGFLALEQLSFGGHYRLWQSASPAGPWTLIDTDVMPGCPSGANVGCYHLWGHPELSTANNLLYSYHDLQDQLIHVTSIGTVPNLP